MADWVSKANYNNPLFTIYHILQFAKHKGMYWGKKDVYRLLRPRMREHFRYASREPPSRTGARNVKDWPFSGVLSPRVILRSSACTFCHTGMFCRRVIKRTEKFIPCTVCHFSSNIVIHISSSLDVCIGVRESAHALLRCVLLSPPQIRIKLKFILYFG